MTTGIYQIRNVINDKLYIGSTTRYFSQRKAEHFKNLRKGIHSSIILQNAWNKYGEKSFKFEILEECTKEKCLEREQYYLDSLNPKYNINKIAENSRGKRWTLSQREKCLCKKGIEAFNFSGQYFKFKNLLSNEEVIFPRFEFANKYNFDRSAISKICNGNIKFYKNWICIEKIER